MNKVAIINRTNLKNYGSVLQCYALCETVRDLGYESEIVWERGNLSKNFDFRPMKMLSSVWKLVTHPSLISSTMTNVSDMNSRKISDATVALFDRFVKEEITQSFFSHRQLKKKAKSDEYKKFICGSDQIWCSTTLYVDPLMYLRFAPRNKRIAYAPSIGRDFIPNYNKSRMKKYISEIPHLSVREVEGQRLIKELTGLDAKVVLDPTLLRKRECWDKLKSTAVKDTGYILCYFLDTPSEQTQLEISRFAEKTERNIIALGSGLSFLDAKGASVKYPDCGPREFLSYVENADTVITDSYHGMLFSIIFEKQFFAIERAYQVYDQSSRHRTVLDLFSLGKRYLKQGEQITEDVEDINYFAIRPILLKKRELSLAFLRNAIENGSMKETED